MAAYSPRTVSSRNRQLRYLSNEDTWIEDSATLAKPSKYTRSASTSSVPILHVQMNRTAQMEKQQLRNSPRGSRPILSNSASRSNFGYKQVRFEDQKSRRSYSYQQAMQSYDPDALFYPSPPTNNANDMEVIAVSNHSCLNFGMESIPTESTEPKIKELSISIPSPLRIIARKPVGSANNSPTLERKAQAVNSSKRNDYQTAQRLRLESDPLRCPKKSDTQSPISKAALSLPGWKPEPFDILPSLISLINVIFSFMPSLPSLSSPEDIREFRTTAAWFAKALVVLYLAASLWAILVAVRDVVLTSLQPIAWMINCVGWMLRMN